MPTTIGAGPTLVRPYSMSFKSFGKRVATASKNINNAFLTEEARQQMYTNPDRAGECLNKASASFKKQGLDSKEARTQAVKDAGVLVSASFWAVVGTTIALVAND